MRKKPVTPNAVQAVAATTAAMTGDTPEDADAEETAPELEPTEWQRLLLADLDAVASEYPEIQIEGNPRWRDGVCAVAISVDTTSFPKSPKARIRLRDRERFHITLLRDERRPPSVWVDHERFLGGAHVMSGYYLCLYLDESREWDPGDGLRGTLERLWSWLEDTAGNKFKLDEDLFYAVGGTLHLTPGTPTIVVRDLPMTTVRTTQMYLRPRPPAAGAEDFYRFDLVKVREADEDLAIPVVPLLRDLPIGAGEDTLEQLMDRIHDTQGLTVRRWQEHAHRALPLFVRDPSAGPVRSDVGAIVKAGPRVLLPDDATWMHGRVLLDYSGVAALLSGYGEPEQPVARLADAILDAAKVNPMGSPQYALVAVPHPAGGPRHLICMRLPVGVADQVREAAAEGINVDAQKLLARSPILPMEWCRVSDERAAVTTRRDVGRPVSVLVGKTVYVWGVGGLGSWLAEFVVRAGAAKVVLFDPGYVTGGLLVRQDFAEGDVGARKDAALASRLRTLRDDVEVVLLEDEGWVESMLDADLVIDATINRSVTRFLDSFADRGGRTAMFAQVATDTATGNLGIAVITAATTGHTLTDLDRAAGEHVKADAELEDYRVFWDDPTPGSEFVPTRGCSIPTFHGSAADLAGISGALLNFICLHLSSGQAGTELVALPQSGVLPPRKLVMPGIPPSLPLPRQSATSAQHVAAAK